jgi:hypothetical protein
MRRLTTISYAYSGPTRRPMPALAGKTKLLRSPTALLRRLEEG